MESPPTDQHPRRGFRDPDLIGWLLLGAAIVVAAAFVFWLERGGTFAWDEFPWAEEAGLQPISSFFQPYGGHLIALPYFVYWAVLKTFGWSFVVFSILQVVGLSAIATLVYIYAKRRLGPILALAPPLVLLFFGSSWLVLMEPMMSLQFLLAIGPGLAAIVLLEHEGRRSDIAACVLLCLSLAAFSMSVAFLCGAIVAIALSRNRWGRAWVVAIPFLAYLSWKIWATKYESTGIVESNIPLLPAYFADALPVYAYALFGLGALAAPGPWTLIRLERYDISFLSEGVVFTVLAILAIAGAVMYMRSRGKIPRTFWPALAMLAGLLTELGIIFGPGRTAAENRYLYGGILLLLLVIVEVFKGTRTTRWTVGIALTLTLAAGIGNLARFREGRVSLDLYQKEARADMTMMELTGHNADPAFYSPDRASEYTPAPFWPTQGRWLEVVDRYGSPADSIPQLRAQAPVIRERADGVATRLLELELKPAPGARGTRCRTVGDGPGAPLGITLPTGGAILRSRRATPVGLGRWGDLTAIPLGKLEAGQAALLRIPPDRASKAVPWHLGLSAGPVEVCPLR